MDNKRLLVDNKNESEKAIGGLHVVVPINRNLSLKLFGQLWNVLEEKT
jgi:hypothetical protein